METSYDNAQMLHFILFKKVIYNFSIILVVIFCSDKYNEYDFKRDQFTQCCFKKVND